MALNFLNSGYFAGSVGIGTESPLKKLSINGGDVAVNNSNSFIVGAAITGNSQIGELGADSGQLQLLTESTRDIKFGSTTYGNIMFLEGTNGNVGINDTSGYGKLAIKTSGTFTFDSNDQDFSGVNIMMRTTNTALNAVGSGMVWLKGNSTSRKLAAITNYSYGDLDQVGLNFYVHPSSAGGSAVLTEAMRIRNTGGISFGTTGTAYGTSGQILKSNGDASPTWIDGSAIPGVPGGSGTLNTVTMWTPDGDTLGDGPITFSGNNSTFTGDITLSGTSYNFITSSAPIDIGVASSAQNAVGYSTLVYAGAPTAGTTNDIAGGHLYLAGGAGKGTGAGGDIVFRIAEPATISGSAINAYSTAATIKSTGNVGIGTASPDYLLDLYKFTDTTSTTTGTTLQRLWNYVGGDLQQQKTFIDFVFQDANANEYPQVRIGAEVGQNGNADSQIKEGSGAFVVYTNNATGDGPGSPTGLAERFRVDYKGDVGIGTNNPFSSLQVGNNTFSGGNGMAADSRVGISNHGSLTGMMLASTYNDPDYPEYGLVFVQGASTASYNVWSISPDGPAKGSGLSFIYKADATNIHNQTPQVYFEGSTGHVGIGTDSPGTKLEISDDTAPTLTLRNPSANPANAGMIRFIESTNTDGFQLTFDGSDNKLKFISDSSGTEATRMVIQRADGNVGIGTTGPSAKLHVDSSTAFSLTSVAGDTLFLSDDTNPSALNGVGASIGFSGPQEVQRQAAIAALRTGADHDHIGLAFYTHPGTSNDETIVEQMRITDSGNVGIGTDDPGYKLTVNGDVDVNNGAILAAQAYGINLGVSGYDIVMPSTNYISIKAGGVQRVNISGGTNTAYVADGLWGATATPSWFATTGGGKLRLGYQDNGSGLYASAYGFETSSTDGLGNTSEIRSIVLKNTNSSAYVFEVSNLGSGKFAKGVQIGDDTDTAVAGKVGTMRYRTGTEYVEVTGTELLPNLDLTNWTSIGSTTTITADTFTTVTSAGGVRKLNFLTVGQVYRAVISGTTTTTNNQINNYGNNSTYKSWSGAGAFNFTFTFTATADTGMYLRLWPGTAEIYSLSVMEVTAEDASYADMCMQTGSSTYEWVNIVRNTY